MKPKERSTPHRYRTDGSVFVAARTSQRPGFLAPLCEGCPGVGPDLPVDNLVPWTCASPTA
jgi:hypothetical protein